MIRLTLLFSLLLCICAGNMRACTVDHQKAHAGLIQKTTGECGVLVADDVDDDHALIKRNIHSFIIADAPVAFVRSSIAAVKGCVSKGSSRSLLTRIGVLRL